MHGTLDLSSGSNSSGELGLMVTQFLPNDLSSGGTQVLEGPRTALTGDLSKIEKQLSMARIGICWAHHRSADTTSSGERKPEVLAEREGWEIVQVEGNQLFQEFRVKFRGEERSRLKSSSKYEPRRTCGVFGRDLHWATDLHVYGLRLRSTHCPDLQVKGAMGLSVIDAFAASQGGAAVELLKDRSNGCVSASPRNTPPSSLARSLKFSWNFGLIELEFRQTMYPPI
ncbi:hypothetical protein DFH09DRAFT_1290987 [Mycena vulgaris]|nr:hypothetical protein DFH09DRAFT_1290987 [Mycena vulgaris]